MDFYRTAIEPLTLKRALSEYYMQNPTFTPSHLLRTKQAQNLVRAHDISHLVFGCGTDSEGELTVQLWTKHAVHINLSIAEKFSYFFRLETLKLVLNPQAIKFFFTRFKDFKRINSEVSKRSYAMNGKWHYFEEDLFLDQTIVDIRKKLNIRVL